MALEFTIEGESIRSPGAVELDEMRLKVLGAYVQYWLNYGFAPSLREVGEQLGVSQTAIQYQVSQLHQAGLMLPVKARHGPGFIPRGIKLKVEVEDDLARLVGLVAAPEADPEAEMLSSR